MSTISDAGDDDDTLRRLDVLTDWIVIAATAVRPAQFNAEVGGRPSSAEPSATYPDPVSPVVVTVATTPATRAPGKGSPMSVPAAIVTGSLPLRVSSSRRGATTINNPSVLARSLSPVTNPVTSKMMSVDVAPAYNDNPPGPSATMMPAARSCPAWSLLTLEATGTGLPAG